jgi:hypothetical protein
MKYRKIIEERFTEAFCLEYMGRTYRSVFANSCKHNFRKFYRFLDGDSEAQEMVNIWILKLIDEHETK